VKDGQNITTMLLCDTNIFIEVFRDNTVICAELEKIGRNNIAISDITLGELFFGAINKAELKMMCNDLASIQIWHINEEISQMAVNMVEQFCLSHKLDIDDALIAATAIYYNIPLFTLNIKDFKFLPNLKLYQLNE
jgi:predicted nucleic acid-binding protein